jgi:hypothetical protein
MKKGPETKSPLRVQSVIAQEHAVSKDIPEWASALFNVSPKDWELLNRLRVGLFKDSGSASNSAEPDTEACRSVVKN